MQININYKETEGEDVEVVRIPKRNEQVDKNLRQALDAIWLGAKYAGRSSCQK